MSSKICCLHLFLLLLMSLGWGRGVFLCYCLHWVFSSICFSNLLSLSKLVRNCLMHSVFGIYMMHTNLTVLRGGSDIFVFILFFYFSIVAYRF